MNYPYPQLVAQLQFLCTPAEYRRIVKRNSYEYQTYPNFWAIMPTYTFARCPLCGLIYREAANTYDLKGWGYTGLANTLYVSERNKRHYQEVIDLYCPHFLGLRKFINLHGNIPVEETTFDNTEGEVPFIEKHFFSYQDIQTYAVLHALPICQVGTGIFVPSYTVFIMSYFSEQPTEIARRTYAKQATAYEIDPEYWPSLVGKAGFVNKANYELLEWAKRGQLGWLNFTESELPLRLGQNEQLPEIYQNIEGQRNEYVIRDGQMIVRVWESVDKKPK